MSWSINNHPNALAIYANPNWKYAATYMKDVVVLFNKNKMPFFIKNGKRQEFNRRANNYGNMRLFYGSGKNNSLLNLSSPANEIFSWIRNHKNHFGFRQRRTVLNSLPVARVRLTKKAAANKKAAVKKTAQNARVNKLKNNVLAGRNISKARLNNLVELIRKHQNANAGPYYYKNNKGKIVRNGSNYPPVNGPAKPTIQQVLANINNFRQYEYGIFRRNNNNYN